MESRRRRRVDTVEIGWSTERLLESRKRLKGGRGPDDRSLEAFYSTGAPQDGTGGITYNLE